MKQIVFDVVIQFLVIVFGSIIFKLIFQDQITWNNLMYFNLGSLSWSIILFLYKAYKHIKNNGR